MFTLCCLRWVTPVQRRGLPFALPVSESVTWRNSSNKPSSSSSNQASSLVRATHGQPLETKNSCHDILIPPTTCCGSGCPNCVWVEYAEKLADYYADGGVEAEKIIERDVTDPSLKAYILMEVRLKARLKK